MGETESSVGRSGRTVKNAVKEPARVMTYGYDALAATERRPPKRTGLRMSSKRNGKDSEEVLTVEVMGFDVDAVSHELGSLKLKDDSNGKSRATGLVLNAVPQEVEGRMGRSFAEASRTSSSEEGDEDNITDREIAGELEEINRTLGCEASALLDELMQVIKEGGELKKLKVDHLKAYLRHHGLRISGLKEVLLSRIEQHLKIKDGQGQVIYPKSSFTINCKGDVCLGDTVLFSQNVYDSYDIVKRGASGPPLGKRWVAGKVVNESYGAEKQQHTFTIEVLWSTGTMPFYVMRPLQIKGRNLYRMHTSRQPWIDEEARKKVLTEKHARGEEARAKRRTESGPRGRSRSRPGSRGHSKSRHQRDSSRSIPPTTQSSKPQKRSLIQHNMYILSTASSSLAGNRPGESRHIQQDVSQGSSITASSRTGQSEVPPVIAHPLQSSMQQGRAAQMQQQQQLGNVVRPASASSTFHGQGIVHIPCSNRGCEKAGAKYCTTQSCAACCFKNGSTRGSCRRHL